MDETLRKLPGVADVEVDFDKKLAFCAVDSEKFDQDAAAKKLQDARFKKAALVKE